MPKATVLLPKDHPSPSSSLCPPYCPAAPFCDYLLDQFVCNIWGVVIVHRIDTLISCPTKPYDPYNAELLIVGLCFINESRVAIVYIITLLF